MRSIVLAVALGVACSLAPIALVAQPSDKTYRIGVLERTPVAVNAANLEGFRQGLRALGYVEGKHFTIEYRSAGGRDERFPALAAKQTTSTIPVVITGVGDPVGQGIIASLPRPGGNITGLSATVTEIYPKRVEILRELVPKATRIAALFNMGNPAIPRQWKEVETAAKTLGLQALLIDVRRIADLRPAFETARQSAEAIVVGLETLTLANAPLIVELAAKHRLPAMYASTEFVGGLASYGVNYPDHYRRAATFADKIFKGAKPADLPVEQPTKLELAINLKTARALGLTIPRTVMLQVNQVVE